MCCRAVKEIVGAQIEKLCAAFLRNTSDIFCALAIDGESQFGIPLAPIHVGVSGGEDDSVRVLLGDQSAHLFQIPDVRVA
jgi:hypothetical protein